MPEKRIIEIDLLRGLALVMMAVFHFLWDLNYFGVTNLALYDGPIGLFQKLTLSLFLFVAGISVALSSSRHKDFFTHSLFRGGKIFLAGMLVTAFSWIFFPERIVFFGILHMIGVSVIIAAPFTRQRIVPLIAGAIVFLLPSVFSLKSLGIAPLYWVGIAQPLPSLDFVPLIPWIGTKSRL